MRGHGPELTRAIHERVPEAKVVVGCDPFAPARAQFSEECEAAFLPSLDDLLARDDVQAVLVASPNHLHMRAYPRRGGRGQARLLREADGAVSRRL